jgi:hypothetical protein
MPRISAHMLASSTRSLTERSADLAVFAAQHSSGYTWEEARKIWNHRHRKTSSYLASNPAQFVRDSRSAYERVTGEELDWDRNEQRQTPMTATRET